MKAHTKREKLIKSLPVVCIFSMTNNKDFYLLEQKLFLYCFHGDKTHCVTSLLHFAKY